LKLLEDRLSKWLVSTDWLAEHLDAPDVAVLDASWHLPAAGRNAKQEFLSAHIPGALFFDIDEISDTSSLYPHMLPSAEKFSSRMRKMGIGDGKKVILYDTLGLYSAARAWWTFRVFGKDDVAVLDGGFPKWKAEARPIEDGEPTARQERHFTARYRGTMVRDRADVLKAIRTGQEQLADARSQGRYAGIEPEPRTGVRSGHIPKARSVPFGKLVNQDGTLKSVPEIEAAFSEAGIESAKPVIAYCGSGVTAAVLALGLSVAGHEEHAIYDGSWTEWGTVDELPIETDVKA
jgi:thiosulfate/3-mercaptopyruvate sulfurtransferase